MTGEPGKRPRVGDLTTSCQSCISIVFLRTRIKISSPLIDKLATCIRLALLIWGPEGSTLGISNVPYNNVFSDLGQWSPCTSSEWRLVQRREKNFILFLHFGMKFDKTSDSSFSKFHWEVPITFIKSTLANSGIKLVNFTSRLHEHHFQFVSVLPAQWSYTRQPQMWQNWKKIGAHSLSQI